ncbi:MAG: hypothetical protein CL470_06070 [Acidimicrobiaceae bacterium]|mgnify:FL=1|nr:hypothetical protein [Acidimicrobiaceae bacterium]|tara:strand:+ start:364 stop:603 length:240 start_codon:yes stop_codon:yes gene_type:complete
MGYKREKHLLEIEAGYNLIYERLLKEARIWNNSGQYWLANESMRKAKQLLNGNVEGCEAATRTEIFFYNKYTGRIGNDL